MIGKLMTTMLVGAQSNKETKIVVLKKANLLHYFKVSPP